MPSEDQTGATDPPTERWPAAGDLPLEAIDEPQTLRVSPSLASAETRPLPPTGCSTNAEDGGRSCRGASAKTMRIGAGQGVKGEAERGASTLALGPAAKERVCSEADTVALEGREDREGVTVETVQLDEPPSEKTIRTPAPAKAELRGSGASPRTLGEYEILGQLGRGGMGVVYRARQRSLGRDVALKVMRAGREADADEIERFRREASAAARLRHPAIVPIHEIGEDRGYVYFAMELIEGEALNALLRREGRLAPRRALEIVATVADALELAHEHDIVHRDVKPANIIIDHDGRPHLTDFGLAKDLQSDSGLTESGQTLGTPSYMSPEQARGQAHTVDARTDIYALGAVLYELLTGEPPFRGEHVLETIRLVAESEPIPPRALVPSLHRDVETICLKCLHKDPERRYPSARALAEDIRRYLEGEMIVARPVSAFERLWRKALKHRAALLALGVALIATVLVTGYLVRQQRALRAQGKSHLQAGIALFDQGRYRDAIASFQRAAALLPNDQRLGEWVRRAREREHARLEAERKREEAATRKKLEAAARQKRLQDYRRLVAAAKAHLDASGPAAERYERYRDAFSLFDKAAFLNRTGDVSAATKGRAEAALRLIETALERAKTEAGAVGLAREWIYQARAIGIEPALLEPLEARLRALEIARGRFERALSAAQDLAESDPAAALEALERARELAGEDPAHRKDLALVETLIRKTGLERALARARAAKDPQQKLRHLRAALEFEPEHPEARALFLRTRADALTPPGFILLPGARVLVGSPDPRDANPVREVEIAPFYLGVYEVSRAEYQRFVDAGAYTDPRWGLERFADEKGQPRLEGWVEGRFAPGTDTYPVTGISWLEASAYARWLSAQYAREHPMLGRVRLPTSEEWEYAAAFSPESDGRHRRTYPWGERYEADRLNAPRRASAGEDAAGRPAPVDAFAGDVSAFGIRQLGGNAHEWTTWRGKPCLRGGSFLYPSQRYARTGWQRPEVAPAYRNPATGFRLAIELPADLETPPNPSNGGK